MPCSCARLSCRSVALLVETMACSRPAWRLLIAAGVPGGGEWGISLVMIAVSRSGMPSPVVAETGRENVGVEAFADL